MKKFKKNVQKVKVILSIISFTIKHIISTFIKIVLDSNTVHRFFTFEYCCVVEIYHILQNLEF